MLDAAFDVLQETVRLYPAAAIGAAFVICYGESLALVSLLLPLFSAMVALGALLANADLMSLLAAWAAASLGAIGGYWTSYALGFHYNDRVEALIKSARYRELFDKAESRFKKWGLLAVLIGRFFKPSRTAVALLAGMSQLPPLQFQAANVVSAVVWTAFMLFSGAILTSLRHLLL